MTPEWARHLPASVRPDDVDVLTRRSLPRAWVAVWAESPSSGVIHHAGRWTGAAELEERSRVVARRFAAAGLRVGDRVVVSAEASADLVVAYVAALRLGLVAVPTNTGYRQREIAHIVADCRPAAAIVDQRERGRWIEDAAPGPVVVVGPDVALSAGSSGAVDLDFQEPADLALVCYTSGTTGVPKGAMLTHGNLLASAEAVALAWRWTASDRLVLALPLFHMHGLGVGLHGTLLTGGSAVLLERFDVDGVLDAASDQAATLFFGVPTMYARLATSARLGELARLRLCVSGSAPLPADLHHRIASGGGQQILERYGMTETVMNVSNPYDGERRPGTVGFPLPGVELALADGEILLRGPNVFGGYWERPADTDASFTPDGWFRTGDLGHVDDHGYLLIDGRKKELIITGGYNVYPREVEDVLRAHTAVADVAVVGTPSDEWGEVVTAFVVADGPCDEADLLAFAGENLAAYKRPRVVRFVDALPRNALGKVLKHELSAL